jgi:hypothetical protein
MSVVKSFFVSLAMALLLLLPVTAAHADNERQSLEELRNTVVNLLQALVDQGLMSREKAAQLVAQAKDKAATDAAVTAQRAADDDRIEPGAVRVPYVPQIVKDEISKQVSADLKPAVVAGVVDQAKKERWGVPGALPEWLTRVRAFGDVTLRAQADMYPQDNTRFALLDFNAINLAGGIPKAGNNVFLNVTNNRDRLRMRARLGLEAQLTPTVTAGIRLASGSLTDPSSESQTLGTGSARYPVGIDQAYIRWDSAPSGTFSHFSTVGGRIPSPWFTPTELVFARDLQFEGLAETVRLGFGGSSADRSHAFLTLGAFPVLEIPLVNKDNKWLLGAQLGTDFRWGDRRERRLRIAAAYYDFLHVTGRRNAPDSTLLNYTAPSFVRYGNTVYDISNSTTDTTINLFGLASQFRLVDISLNAEVSFERYMAAITAEVVRNIGYKLASVQSLTGQAMPSKEDTGYVGEVSFGDPKVDRAGKWRARVGYRYVKRDAVLDAWTDTDFHGGGTNAIGYYVWTEFGLARDLWTRLRYLSANEVDGPNYGFDMVQLDLNARF